MSLDAPARPGDTLRPAWHGPAPTRAPAFVPGPARARYRPRARADGIPIDHIVVALACLALVLMNAVPSTLLTYLKIHYVTTGGSVVEKPGGANFRCRRQHRPEGRRYQLCKTG